MAGIFSRGFGFPSTSLAAAAAATAKGSAGSRAGAGLSPRGAHHLRRRKKKKKKKKKKAEVGELRATQRAHLRGAGMLQRTGRGAQLVRLDGCCSRGRVLSPLGVAYSRALGSQGRLPLAILLLGARGLESHINLSLHLRSEVVPLWKRSRGHARLPLREAGGGCERRGKARTAEEGEGGPAQGVSRPPRGSCRPGREHRSVTATQRRGESPRKVSLGVTVSHHCPEARRTDS